AAPKHGPHEAQGGGIVIELDNAFIDKYQNRATIETEFTIVKLSAVHPLANDGEVHIGGWADAGGLATVAEVMNAASTGADARKAFARALEGGRKVTAAGAWRIWCEHGGTTPQIQAVGPKPAGDLPGAAPSNPDHVFEVHPVTTVKVGDQVTSGAAAIGATPGFTPHDAAKAFLQGYEKLASKIIPQPGNRTRIVTEASRFNFTEFIFRLDEDVHELEDGHGVIGSVYDTEGELVVRNRRAVFVKGTAADEAVKAAAKGDRFHLIGIPRISLKLVKYRLDHKDELEAEHGTNPLDWRLPYELIAVSAVPAAGGSDE
ncbi:MAG: hypothetical protein J2P46_18250, partial [Zavarzinella sp.]|nr:hypothetical protein [Zavarzinella sp.]